MPDEALLAEIYETTRDKKLPSKYKVLQATMFERADELGLTEYVEEHDIDNPMSATREVYEELAIEHLEDSHEKYLSIPVEPLLDHHATILHKMSDEEKKMCVYDPDDELDDLALGGSNEGNLEVDPDVMKVLDQIVETSDRAQTREEAIDVAVECYQPFLNDNVMTALREIGGVLLSDDNTPQVSQGTEAEIVRYALTALIHTFNKEAQKQGADAPAEQAAEEVQRNG